MISLYGILIATAITTCLYVAHKRFKQSDVSEEDFWDLCFFIIVWGIVGARVYHVLGNLGYYTDSPIRILQVWHGGLGIWGAIVAGILVVLVKGIKLGKVWLYLDLITSVLPAGQAIGRLGNYVNQENFGYPAPKPLGVYVSPQNRPVGYENYNHFLPIFFIEALLDLLLFLVLTRVAKKHPAGKGIVFASYFVGYGIIRFSLDFFRINPWRFGNLDVSQILSALSILAGILIIARNKSLE